MKAVILRYWLIPISIGMSFVSMVLAAEVATKITHTSHSDMDDPCRLDDDSNSTTHPSALVDKSLCNDTTSLNHNETLTTDDWIEEEEDAGGEDDNDDFLSNSPTEAPDTNNQSQVTVSVQLTPPMANNNAETTTAPTTTSTITPTTTPTLNNPPTLAPTTSTSTPTVVRILPLGDSITSNGFGYFSYRYYLWNLLHTDPRFAGIHFDFVGTLRDNYNGNPTWEADKNFDQDHEGHWGWTLDQILVELEYWLGFLNASVAPFEPLPGLVLIHLGTNNCIEGQDSPEVIVDKLQQVVDVLHRHNPYTMTTIVSTLIPANYAGIQPCLDAVNQLLLLDGHLQGEHVLVADLAADFSVEQDSWDNLHPNNQGSEKMARVWLESIVTALDNPRVTNDPW